MENEFEQKRCKVDNALLFEVDKDGETVRVKGRKCGSIRVVNLATHSEPEYTSPDIETRERS